MFPMFPKEEFLCPTRVAGMLMLLYINKCPFGRKRVRGVRDEQGVQRQLTSSKGPERMGNFATMEKGPPSK
jgi:hypothetical protein